MTDLKIMCLFFMFQIGVVSVAVSAEFWKGAGPKGRALMVAWVWFWLIPPLWFLWTKGVMG